MSTNLNNKETNVIDYLADVKELEDAGVADDVISQHLSIRTMRAMSCSDARVIIQESGAVVEDPVAGTRAGSLINHYTALPQGEAKSLLGWFISHVFGNGETVSTDSYPRSLQWASVTAGMDANLQVVTQSLVDAAGGQREEPVTAEQISEARETYLADQAAAEAEREARANFDVKKARYDELYNEFIAPLQIQPGVTDADWSAALNSMASNFPLPIE